MQIKIAHIVAIIAVIFIIFVYQTWGRQEGYDNLKSFNNYYRLDTDYKNEYEHTQGPLMVGPIDTIPKMEYTNEEYVDNYSVFEETNNDESIIQDLDTIKMDSIDELESKYDLSKPQSSFHKTQPHVEREERPVLPMINPIMDLDEDTNDYASYSPQNKPFLEKYGLPIGLLLAILIVWILYKY